LLIWAVPVSDEKKQRLARLALVDEDAAAELARIKCREGDHSWTSWRDETDVRVNSNSPVMPLDAFSLVVVYVRSCRRAGCLVRDSTEQPPPRIYVGWQGLPIVNPPGFGILPTIS
jgi:hypothetical protein